MRLKSNVMESKQPTGNCFRPFLKAGASNPTTVIQHKRFSFKAYNWCLLAFLFFVSFRLSASISGSTVVCANSSSQYTTSPTAGYIYLWNVTGAAQSAANSNTFTVTWGPYSAATSGLITLIVKNSFGVTVGTYSLNVSINPLPIPKIKPLKTNGCSNTLPPVTTDGGTVTGLDSSANQCYMVCDSTIYEYQPVFPSATQNYVWSVIPSSAAIGMTVASGGNVLLNWGRRAIFNYP